MRLLATGIGLLAALVLAVVSASMNVSFLAALGRTETESLILGAASGAADGLKALLPFFIVWAWRAWRYGFVIPASFVWVLFVGFSLLSAFGFAAGNRIGKAGEQAAMNAELTRVQNDKNKLQERLASLPNHRPAAVVQAAIAAARQHPRWQSTQGCSDATVPDSRRFCAAYYRLIGELAAAKQADGIRRQIRKLAAQGKTLVAKGAGRSVDPQSQLLSSILGLGSDHMQLALITILAIVVELG
ncbi:MAG: hypothetical protein AAGC70_19190 [Pseudomonadota bacterium]